MDRMRAIENVPYERWGCDVPMIPLSAGQLLGMQRDYAEFFDGEHRELSSLCEFFAELLSLVVHDPKLSKEGWLEQASLSELTELGPMALTVSGLDVEQKKSESPGRATDSPSS